MQVSYEFNHDISIVYSTLTDPDFLAARALKLGSIEANGNLEVGESNQKITLTRKRKINVPSVLKAFLKNVQTAVTQEIWCAQGDGYRCDNTTDIQGAPLAITGQINLAPSVNGCTFIASFKPDAKIMLGARKLEKYAAKTIAKEIELECEYTAKHLAAL